ncbi:type II secretion system protein [Psychrobacillus insolitus]|nr:type II secretion system protein [Psychrobacillus insolitus]
MTKFKKIFKNEKGLTLIELLAVIVILGIVAAIATPAIGNIIDNSKDKAILSDAASILSGAKIAMTDGVCATGVATVCEQGELTGYVDGITKGTYSATKTDTGWTVTYSQLGILKNAKYSTVKSTNPVTEILLNVALQE